MALSQPPGGSGQEEENEKQRAVKVVVQRAQWLRAAILGANDGLISTASLMLGVGAAKEGRHLMVLSGLAGALAGALSMAVGEFVSVATQRDIEKSATLSNRKSESYGPRDVKITITARPLKTNEATAKPDEEENHSVVRELAQQSPSKSKPASPGRSTLRVIVEGSMNSTKENTFPDVMTEDGKDEQKEGREALPNPYKAAIASALAFLCGSSVPLASAIFVARNNMVRVIVVALVSSVALAVFGGVGAHLGGLPIKVSVLRVLIGGCIAMGITYGLLKPFEDYNEGQENAK